MNPKHVRLSANEKITLISNLSTMLAAGIPILEAVSSLLEESKGQSRFVLETLRDDLLAGNHVHASFVKFPHVFNRVTVNIIKASEETGTLEITLKDIKKNLQQEMEFMDKVKAAMTYPILVMAVFGGVLATILVVVMPKIAVVFTRLRVDLPLPTRILIGLSDLVTKSTPYFIIGGLALLVMLVVLYRTQRQVLFRIIFALPLVSDLIRQIDLTRFSRSLFLLLSSGLPIATALELAEDVVLRKDVGDLLKKAREMVVSGKPFSEGLRSSKKKLVPGMMIKLIEVGEKSGTLDKSLEDISENLDYNVTKSLKTVTALLEPLMLVGVGIGVGIMMLAIIAPIYGLISQVGA